MRKMLIGAKGRRAVTQKNETHHRTAATIAGRRSTKQFQPNNRSEHVPRFLHPGRDPIIEKQHRQDIAAVRLSCFAVRGIQWVQHWYLNSLFVDWPPPGSNRLGLLRQFSHLPHHGILEISLELKATSHYLLASYCDDMEGHGGGLQSYATAYGSPRAICKPLLSASPLAAAIDPIKSQKLFARLWEILARSQRAGWSANMQLRDSSNSLIPFHAICTLIQTRKKDDNCVITVIPVGPRIRANRSANP